MSNAAGTRRWRRGESAAPLPALGKLRLGPRYTRIPCVLQAIASDCGSACLAMILGFHGKEVRLEDLREGAGYGRDGTDALSLLEAARPFGLLGRGVKVEEVEDLQLLPRASVLHWRFNHFVVFDRVEEIRLRGRYLH